MKYITILIIFNSFTIFGAAHNKKSEWLQYLHGKEKKRQLIRLYHSLSNTEETYTRNVSFHGPAVISKATLDHTTGNVVCQKTIYSPQLLEGIAVDSSLFEELKQQYDHHYKKQINAHRLALLALNEAPAPFVTQEIEKLMFPNVKDLMKTYFIFNTYGIRTKVSSDDCYQRSTDSDDMITSWNLTQHKETAQTIYSLAKRLYKKQKLAELRIDSQGQHQK